MKVKLKNNDNKILYPVTKAELVEDLATVAVSNSYNDLDNKLTAGTGITIADNVISATSGGGATTLYKHLILCTCNEDLVELRVVLPIATPFTSSTTLGTFYYSIVNNAAGAVYASYTISGVGYFIPCALSYKIVDGTDIVTLQWVYGTTTYTYTLKAIYSDSVKLLQVTT